MKFLNFTEWLTSSGSPLSKACVLALSNVKRHKITILTARDDLSTSQISEGIRVVKTDYSDNSLLAEFSGQDVVVSTLEDSALKLESRVIEVTICSSVIRFILSDFSIDTADRLLMKLVYLLQKKVERQSQLKKVVADHLNFSYTFLSSGLWFDHVGRIFVS